MVWLLWWGYNKRCLCLSIKRKMLIRWWGWMLWVCLWLCRWWWGRWLYESRGGVWCLWVVWVGWWWIGGWFVCEFLFFFFLWVCLGMLMRWLWIGCIMFLRLWFCSLWEILLWSGVSMVLELICFCLGILLWIWW